MKDFPITEAELDGLVKFGVASSVNFGVGAFFVTTALGVLKDILTGNPAPAMVSWLWGGTVIAGLIGLGFWLFGLYLYRTNKDRAERIKSETRFDL